MSSKSKSLLSAGLSLSFFTLCSRILGLVREMTKAAFLGTSKYADAFGIAFMIPNLLRRLFAENAISVAFIPTFKGYLEERTPSPASQNDSSGNETVREFLSATLTLVTFLTTCVVVLGIFLTPLIVRIFLDNSDTHLIAETSILTRIMFPYLIVISIAAFFQGVLNGVKIFSPSGFTPVLFNTIVILATYVLTPIFTGDISDSELKAQMAARAMSIGVISGGLVQALFQLPFVLKTGWTFHFTSLKKAFSNEGTRRVIKLIVPTIIGMAAYQLNDVVSTALAGKAGTGIVSSLQYSLRLQELILGIFAVSIGTVILPDLSGLAKKGLWTDFNQMLIQASKIMALISIPITFLSLLCGEEIISLVYKSKKFSDESVHLTLVAFRMHIAGLFFIALNRIISPAFYAQGNTKSPTLAGILGFAVNIILAFLALLFHNDGTGSGIALALSVASFANTVFLFLFLRKNQNLNVKSVTFGTVFYALKLIILSLIACVPSYFVKNSVTPFFEGRGRLIGFGLPFAITALCYGTVGIALLVLTKDEIVQVIVKKIRKR
ncbi:MAG: murein biosynthesis integral membrane protein MurJ [Treponema sp.]|nr:murein biosynthesis integral membrane protein MurJ [Treponema sp.]